jgi:hypothetical protein
MSEASPDWLTKVQIDNLALNYATNVPKIQQLSSSRAKVQKQGYQSERSSSSQKAPQATHRQTPTSEASWRPSSGLNLSGDQIATPEAAWTSLDSTSMQQFQA